MPGVEPIRWRSMPCPLLAAKMGEEPEQERQNEADDEASDDGEIERGVLASVDDVARKAAEPKGETAAEIKQCADKSTDGAEDEEGAAELAERVHRRILGKQAVRKQTCNK